MEAANQSEDHKLSNTDLAFERTVLAENRTLMAWIRTAISLISFGFTIYKFFHEVSEKQGPTRLLLTSREVGMLMITIGLLTLTWGLMEHRRVIKKTKKKLSCDRTVKIDLARTFYLSLWTRIISCCFVPTMKTLTIKY